MIADLDVMQSVPIPAWDEYEPGGDGPKQLPPKGRYRLRSKAFQETDLKEVGSLVDCRIDPVIAEGPSVGTTVTYQSVSNRPYDAANLKKGSSAQAYLAATGVLDAPDYRMGFQQAQEQLFEANLDWRGYDKETGTAIKGMDSFDKDAEGKPLPWYTVTPTTPLAPGQLPKRIWANLRITSFVIPQEIRDELKRRKDRG